jgi:TM2 domain-containing membrane protein YozV
MKKKSKFLTFVLSCVPGLGHIYLGLMQRGMVFLLTTAFVIIGGMFFAILHIFYDPIPFVLLPFIWLAALVDSLILADRINRQAAESQALGENSSQIWKNVEEELKGQNGKILALAFSIIPGAGHMYVGEMEKGIQLMAAFFLTLYLSDFLNLSLLLMFAPILWFYSIFDILHKVSHPDKQQNGTFLGDFFRENHFPGKAGKFLGIGLIAVGCIMIFDKIVMPQIAIMFDHQIREYFRTGIIALLFIAGGIKLMMGSKEKDKTLINSGAQGTPNEEADTEVKGVE